VGHPPEVGTLPRRAGGLLEGFDGGGFVVLHVKDGVELGDLEQIVHLLGEVEEFEFAALILGGGEGADQFADAGAVDVVDLGQVQDDFLIAFGKQFAHGVAQSDAAFAQGDASAAVNNRDAVDLPSAKFHAH